LDTIQVDLRALREARANLDAYRKRFTTPESAMNSSLAVAMRCIDRELERVSAARQLTITELLRGEHDSQMTVRGQ